MSDGEQVTSAPALSTYQDECTFSYAQIPEGVRNKQYLGLDSKASSEDTVQAIRHYYDLDELVTILAEQDEETKERRYKKVTLQFPDELLGDSACIVQELQRELGLIVESSTRTENSELCSGQCSCGSDNNTCHVKKDESEGQKIWILADTSYSACCVDEVAAEHVKSDLVIHFGDACLNTIESLPVVYVFGRPIFDVEAIRERFVSEYPEKEAKILLMADATNTRYLKGLYERLLLDYPNIAYADLVLDPKADARIIGYNPQTVVKPINLMLNRNLVGIDFECDEEEEQEAREQAIDSKLCEYSLFHITQPHAPRLLQLITKFETVKVYNHVEDEMFEGPFPNLRVRYRALHMARAAGTVGLLVNTLSLANTKNLLNLMAKKIKKAGKKLYTFVVGKPNIAKLANFEAIDVWCVLGCDHQGIILDQDREYYKPIVTPFELSLVLGDEFSWTGKWVTDYQRVISLFENGQDEEPDQQEAMTSETYEDTEEPTFNPVTGQFAESRPLRRLQYLQISGATENDSSSTAVVKKLSSEVAIKGSVSTSAVTLQNRSWTGLGSDFNEDLEEGSIAEQGRGGIARGYDYDKDIHAI